MNEYNILIQLH